jgi:hypothetical protein
MEFNTIMQALVKDIAEQLRPMVADMVRQELTVCQPDMAVIAQNIDLDVVAGHINLALLAEEVDLDHAIGEWFSNQSFTIRTN